MPHPEADLHLRLDLLHRRPSAVTATIIGTPTHTMRALLALHRFEPLDDTTMVMARDREEAHHAEQAARALRAEGVTVDITPQLREEIDTEWTWANYPMPGARARRSARSPTTPSRSTTPSATAA